MSVISDGLKLVTGVNSAVNAPTTEEKIKSGVNTVETGLDILNRFNAAPDWGGELAGGLGSGLNIYTGLDRFYNDPSGVGRGLGLAQTVGGSIGLASLLPGLTALGPMGWAIGLGSAILSGLGIGHDTYERNLPMQTVNAFEIPDYGKDIEGYYTENTFTAKNETEGDKGYADERIYTTDSSYRPDDFVAEDIWKQNEWEKYAEDSLGISGNSGQYADREAWNNALALSDMLVINPETQSVTYKEGAYQPADREESGPLAAFHNDWLFETSLVPWKTDSIMQNVGSGITDLLGHDQEITRDWLDTLSPENRSQAEKDLAALSITYGGSEKEGWGIHEDSIDENVESIYDNTHSLYTSAVDPVFAKYSDYDSFYDYENVYNHNNAPEQANAATEDFTETFAANIRDLYTRGVISTDPELIIERIGKLKAQNK